MDYNAELVADIRAVLGEGVFWDSDKSLLYWVDIESGKIHTYDPRKDCNSSITMKGRVSTVVPKSGSGFLIAEDLHVAAIDEKGETYNTVASFNRGEGTRNRLNDGKCDPAGRFWVGTMNMDGALEKAHLYRVNNDYTCETILSGVSISNGIAWNTENSKMFYIDTPTLKVSCFDFDLLTGAISNRKTVITIPESLGFPDGMAIDSEGMLWIALFGGYGVGRWNPETGRLIDKVELPVKNVTSCAFGGENLNDLYITTARFLLTDSELEEQPVSGGLFRCRVRATGLSMSRFIEC